MSSRSWYQEPWFWFVIGVPLFSVLLSLNYIWYAWQIADEVLGVSVVQQAWHPETQDHKEQPYR
jgi:hypothetical protein